MEIIYANFFFYYFICGALCLSIHALHWDSLIEIATQEKFTDNPEAEAWAFVILTTIFSPIFVGSYIIAFFHWMYKVIKN